jgi:hypothetical protein
MGISVIPAPSAASKTMFRTSLTSGTSWTVPAGVTYVNVTLYGGGGGGGGANYNEYNVAGDGLGGQVISSTLSTTPGASIAYSIGAGGVGGAGGQPASKGSSGGTTTFTGATSAAGGNGGVGLRSGQAGSDGVAGAHSNGGGGSNSNNSASASGGTGGPGKIDIEYWA